MALLAVFAVACSTPAGTSLTAPSPTDASGTGAISSLSGSWRTASATNAAGPCSGITYTLTPTGASSATATYGATCAGVTISGSGTAVASGSSVSWTAAGTAGPCGFTLTGTLTPAGPSSATLVYAGSVCGMPVSGSEILTR